MAKFQVLVTMWVEAPSDSEASARAQAALSYLAPGRWPDTPILAWEVAEVTPVLRGPVTLTDQDNTLD